MATKAPITRISLPTHYPAVSACTDGGMVTLKARKVPTEEPMLGMAEGGKPKGPQPPPTNTDFHVMDIEPGESEAEERAETPAKEKAEQAKAKPAGKAKKPSPMEYLKGKQ